MTALNLRSFYGEPKKLIGFRLTHISYQNDSELANSMLSISSGMDDIIGEDENNGTAQLTSRDVNDMAFTFQSMEKVLNLPKSKESDDHEMTEDDIQEMKKATTALVRHVWVTSLHRLGISSMTVIFTKIIDKRGYVQFF